MNTLKELSKYKIGLKSDFRDYYDHWFTPSYQSPKVFLERYAKPVCCFKENVDSNLNINFKKREQLRLLDTFEMTPTHGIVKELPYTSFKLVVYLDEYAHCGEGKILIDSQEAREKYPDCYASFYIESKYGKAISKRLLQIGNRSWWLEYTNHEKDWRSNVGENIEIKIKGETDCFWVNNQRNSDLLKNYPIFAIDFVESFCGEYLYAIDFNTSPGLLGTGIEEILYGNEVFKLIAEYLQ